MVLSPFLHVSRPQKSSPKAALVDLDLPSDDQVWRCHGCWDCIDPIGERCTGKLEALDMGNMAF